MIVLRAVRVEDTGAETELGEVRMTEVGAVYSHAATADGGAVVADVVERLRTPAALRPIARAKRGRPSHDYYSRAPSSWLERLRREGRCEGCASTHCRCGTHT